MPSWGEILHTLSPACYIGQGNKTLLTFPFEDGANAIFLSNVTAAGAGKSLQSCLSSPSPPAFSLSQHWDLSQRVGSSHQVAKVSELQLQHQSFQ